MAWVRQYLDSYKDNPIQLRRFLIFATESSSTNNTIQINDTSDDAQHLPVSHTCFYRIDIPAYGSYATLKRQFDLSLNNEEAVRGFGLM